MKMKKADLILIAVAAAAAAIGGCFLFFSRSTGAEVVVMVNQKETARFPLDQDREYTISSADDGMNLLVIQDGVARVTDANCPDQICVKDYARGIQYEGESIICLPHKVEVYVEGGEANTDAPDVIVGH